MHAVFCFVEDDGLRTFKDLIRDLHGVKAIFLADLLADCGIQIMECRQAVHEAALRPGLRHKLCVDLIGQKVMNPRLPDLVRLSHRDPHVRVDHIRTLNRVYRIRIKFQHCAGLPSNRFACLDQVRIREIRFRRAGDKVHAHLRTADHKRVAHVIPRVAHIDKLLARQVAKMLLNRQKVGEDLCGMEFVCQAIPDRNTCVLCQIFDDLLPVTPVFNAIVHAAEHARSICNRFLFANLRAGRVEIGDCHAQIMRCNLKRAACARAGLFKNQRGLLSLAQPVGDTCLFLRLEFGGERQKLHDLFRRKIQQL